MLGKAVEGLDSKDKDQVGDSRFQGEQGFGEEDMENEAFARTVNDPLMYIKQMEQ